MAITMDEVPNEMARIVKELVELASVEGIEGTYVEQVLSAAGMLLAIPLTTIPGELLVNLQTVVAELCVMSLKADAQLTAGKE